MRELRERLSGWMTLILIVGLLSGCATNYCTWVTPIYPSKEDKLTRGTKQQILIHNETWEKEGGK